MRIPGVLLCLIFTVCTVTVAEAVTFDHEHVYRKKEIDTKESCSAIAWERAKRELLAKIGAAFSDDARIRKSGITMHQFAVLSAVVFRPESVHESQESDSCLVRIRLDADMDRAVTLLEASGNDGDLLGVIEQARNRADEAMSRLDTLRVMLAYLKGRPDEALLSQFDAEVGAIRAVDLFEQGISLFIGGEFNSSEFAFEKAITHSPDFAAAYYFRGRAYAEQGNYDKAIKDFDRTAELVSDDFFGAAYLLGHRGMAYLNVGDYDAAQKDFERAIELDPDDSQGYSNRGMLLLRKREFQKAIMDFMRAAQLNPRNADVYVSWGMAFVQMQEYQKAVRELDRAIRLAPESRGAYETRALAHAGMGNHRLAAADYSKALDRDPGNSAIRYRRGLSFMALGDYENAVSDFDLVIKGGPEGTDAYFQRGEALIGLGRAQLALLDFNRAIEHNQHDARAYRRRGFLLLYEMNDELKGCSDWSRACTLGECEDYHRAREKGYCRR